MRGDLPAIVDVQPAVYNRAIELDMVGVSVDPAVVCVPHDVADFVDSGRPIVVCACMVF